MVILEENNPNKAIEIFIEGKQKTIAANERVIINAKETISLLNNDIECLKQMMIEEECEKSAEEIER